MERDATTDMLVAELRQVIADLRQRGMSSIDSISSNFPAGRFLFPYWAVAFEDCCCRRCVRH
jgi:hypothetical protein